MRTTRARWFAPLALLAVLGCAGSRDGARGPESAPLQPPEPDTSGFHATLVQAIREAREAIRAEPQSAARWGRLGMILQVHDLTRDAATCYREAARLDPRDFRWPYLEAVQDDLGTQPPEDKLELLLRAQSLNPCFAPLRVRLGDLLLSLDRAGEARPHYEQAHASDPGNAHALVGLARVDLAGGHPERARRWLEQARYLAPENDHVFALLARVYYDLGLTDLAARAEELARRTSGAEMHDPVLDEVLREERGPDALVRRADLLLDIGELEQAVALLGAVVDAEPDDLDARIDLARVLFYLWREDEAREQLAAARALDESIDVPELIERWTVRRFPRPGAGAARPGG